MTGCASSKQASAPHSTSSAAKDFTTSQPTVAGTTSYLTAKVPALDQFVVGSPIESGNVVVEWAPQALSVSQIPSAAPSVADQVEKALFLNPNVKMVRFEVAFQGHVYYETSKAR
jgi:hypothetical protein